MFLVIMDNMPILQEDEKMRNILSKHKILKSKRQPYNLKRLLTKAKFTSNDTCEVRKCTRPNYGLCTYLLEGNSFAFNCRMNFKIHENMSCDVKNVIYVMKCRGCRDEYIGETGNYLRKRVTVHNQQIRDPVQECFKSVHILTHVQITFYQNITFSHFTKCTQRVQLYDGQRRNSSLTA